MTNKTIKTPHGEFVIHRKDTKAITVIRCRRAIKHHKKWREQGEIVHIEHLSNSPSRSYCGWYAPIATYDLDGKKLLLKNGPQDQDQVQTKDILKMVAIAHLQFVAHFGTDGSGLNDKKLRESVAEATGIPLMERSNKNQPEAKRLLAELGYDE